MSEVGGILRTISSMQEVDIQVPEIEAIISRLLGCNVTSIERIGGGRNSKAYRIICGNSNKYLVKLYFHNILDNRDRLEVEFSSLQFLWENGMRCIPRPIAADKDRRCAVYEYIEGNKIPSQEVTNFDIEFAVQFLARLKDLKSRKESTFLPPASEACFSVRAIVSNIELRLNRLSTIRNDEIQHGALHEFLTNDFMPSFHEITRWCKSSLSESRISFVSELPYEERTLSPSDFGFHNALRRSDGHIVFHDFEYFGWDDPAKMVSDFLLHPAMDLSKILKRKFVTDILRGFEEYRHIAQRIKSMYPLFGLKWCLIFLNEFLPEHFLRRQFAGISKFKKNTLQMEQLSKAKQMLYRINQEHEHFSYFD